MKFIAKGDHVLVVRKEKSERRIGGIILPNTLDEKIFQATILSVGTDLEDMKLHDGDAVLVTNFPNKTEIGKNKDGTIYAVDSEDIICSLEDYDENEDYD